MAEELDHDINVRKAGSEGGDTACSDDEEADGEVMRLAASKVALLVGLHEFGDVTEAFLEVRATRPIEGVQVTLTSRHTQLVYQDREDLLEQDARQLSLRVVSAADELRDLVAKSGPAVAPQLQQILLWTAERGARPTTISTADDLLRGVNGLVEAAQRKRTLDEEEAAAVKRQLQEKIRQSFGARNEDAAIKTYEAQNGYGEKLMDLLWGCAE
ncbi:hypothetical protein ATCC90586_005896 [Pythium insidiosum]|nr:hypothetical protein ATCC90586_005896 [Pythium insidiosum]